MLGYGEVRDGQGQVHLVIDEWLNLNPFGLEDKAAESSVHLLEGLVVHSPFDKYLDKDARDFW